MNTPQERVIKKMIDNIVESNKPVFERPATHATTPAAATGNPSPQPAAPSVSATPEEASIITRKLDYGFDSLRRENAELRKQLEELKGMISMLRNDMDTVRQTVLRAASGGGSPQGSPRRDAPTEPMTSSGGGSLGAPQYRKSEADEAYERQQGGGHEEAPASSQVRGFQKKEDIHGGAQIDINKVFYYGKK